MADTREQIVEELNRELVRARKMLDDQRSNPKCHETQSAYTDGRVDTLDYIVSRFKEAAVTALPLPAGEQQGEWAGIIAHGVAEQCRLETELAALRTQLSTAEQRVKEAEEIAESQNDWLCYWKNPNRSACNVGQAEYYTNQIIDRWAAYRAKYEVRNDSKV